MVSIVDNNNNNNSNVNNSSTMDMQHWRVSDVPAKHMMHVFERSVPCFSAWESDQSWSCGFDKSDLKLI